jgi:hypothetical protein
MPSDNVLTGPDSGPSSGKEIDTVQKLLQAMCGAVKGAQTDIQQKSNKRIEWFFPTDPTTKEVKARMVKIPIPNAKGVYEEREIPLFGLVPQHDLMIGQVTIRMKLSLLDLIGNGDRPDVAAKIPTAGADPELLAEIEIRLKGTEAVEGIARINDAIVKRI